MAESDLPLTNAQTVMLRRLSTGGKYVCRTDVQVARLLTHRGLVILTDDGALGRGNRDGERWYAQITDVGLKRIR